MEFIDKLKTIAQEESSQLIQIPFVKNVFAGSTSDMDLSSFRVQFIKFYTQYYHWVKSIPPIFSIAIGRISDEYRIVRDWLYQSTSFEHDHYDFIVTDLKELGVSETSVKNTNPVPSMDALIGYNHYFIFQHHPVGVLGTHFLMGNFSNQFSLSVADNLEKKLNVHLTFFDAHGHLDVQQSEGLVQVLKTITDSNVQNEIIFNLRTINMLYMNFLKTFNSDVNN